jgi:hypothetical protein
MSDKKMSDTTDHELILEFVDQLKSDNQRLKKELEDKKQPKYLINTHKLDQLFDHWTWGTLTVVAIILSVIYTLYFIWPSTYETGRFYLTHEAINTVRCPDNPSATCWLPLEQRSSCYKVIKEIENGSDDIMTACINDKDEAYKTANEFADEWKRLKGKEGRCE